MDSLDLQGLQRTWQSGEISSASLVAVGEWFELIFMTKAGVLRLVNEEGASPRFADLGEALQLLNSIGVHELCIDMLNSVPDRNTNYERWLNKKVQSSIAGLANGSNRTYTPAEWDAIRVARKVRGGS